MVITSQVLLSLSVFCIVVLSCLVVVTKSDQNEPILNYMTTAELPDGEHEVRMRFGDIIVREASVSDQNENGVK